MQLPKDQSQYTVRTRFGRYAARRLKCARFDDLADECSLATRSLREAGRAEEDTEDAVQDAMAARDNAADALASQVKDLRHALAGRSLNAAKEAPYTRIFPEGVEHYTAAPQAEVPIRHRQLILRLEQHLPDDDELRTRYAEGIAFAAKDHADAVAALEVARHAQREAGHRLDEAATAWNQSLVRTYGTLIARLGKAEAERFFPRVHPSRPRKKADGEQKPADPAAPDAKKPLRSVA